jgi:SAM-dependent methyltransferase
MTQGDREQRLVFGEVAELYDRYRPGYPGTVFDRLMEFGPLRSGDRALEIGAGTGRATRPLAERGLAVTAVEPSSRMAELARRNTEDLPGVTVEEGSFEGWALPKEPFRLVVSAQAWHWVRPEIGYPKARAALAPEGLLALLWNRPLAGSGRASELSAEIDEVYRREAPQLSAGLPGERDLDRRTEIEASGDFVEVVREQISWAATYSSDEYLGLLQTQSDHRLLDPGSLERLLTGIAAVLSRQGGALQQSYVTELYLARPRR